VNGRDFAGGEEIYAESIIGGYARECWLKLHTAEKYPCRRDAEAYREPRETYCRVRAAVSSSVTTKKLRKFACPNEVVIATSAASRPDAINTRPIRD
jgi:hypothetical protein